MCFYRFLFEKKNEITNISRYIDTIISITRLKYRKPLEHIFIAVKVKLDALMVHYLLNNVIIASSTHFKN